MSDVTQRSSVLFYRSCLYISSIMRCSTHTITKMSLFFGAVAISTMALAVATNHWIIAWETTTPYVWTLSRIFLIVETINLILVRSVCRTYIHTIWQTPCSSDLRKIISLYGYCSVFNLLVYGNRSQGCILKHAICLPQKIFL